VTTHPPADHPARLPVATGPASRRPRPGVSQPTQRLPW